MGIFTRLRDIISSNINAMLEKAEDPEKLVKLMIQEMEDTLVEIKASCAGAMAAKKKVERALEEARKRAEAWGDKAQLAVDKGRDDLAREALLEKRRYGERAAALEKELTQSDAVVEQYQSDIMKLEDKLNTAREKQRVLVQRHTHAQHRKRAEKGIRKVDTSGAMVRFEQFENRIERMEAEADLVNFGKKPPLESEFAKLEGDEELEKELEALKATRKKGEA
ncbi:MAG TPA: phage shock protein PspA [Candidatus Hydrogenedentes bacterium]|nr:phage shock protein PspA [Candidatus Hydrogenedentota bacterium]